MRPRSLLRIAAIAFGFVLLAASCSSGGDESSKDSGDKSTAISSVEDAKGAAVQVLTEGGFRDVEDGMVASAGSGSGFIVDPSGIVVTNNHVVAGAGTVKVLVGGDDKEISADVLGVSECNDLAVLQLDDEGPWPYLDWSDVDPEPPMDIYALGFPLGDPEYTVTKGVVSKANADGESGWASVEGVIEHDANIQPGNSGGALVADNGTVVGVNYASSSSAASSTEQFQAISWQLAKDVVEDLKEGDRDSIGVNGTAVVDESTGLAGIWVNGVSAGSPAKQTGVLPGDIITSMNGVQLDSGTLEEYCDVLRSTSDDEPISIRVIRLDTSEELEGELHGDELVSSVSFANQLGDDVAGDPGAGAPVGEYVSIADDTDRIATVVPDTWSDVSLAPQDLLGLGSPQPTLVAAPSQAAFDSNAGAGVTVVLIDDASALGAGQVELLDSAVEGTGCAETAREDYADSLLTGPFAIVDCDGVAGVILIASVANNPDLLVLVLGAATTDDELAVLDEVMANLVVV